MSAAGTSPPANPPISATVSAGAPGPLKFKVAPNIVEDLGLNLYTSLPRVLVEFVANAHDADSPTAEITIAFDAIYKARTAMRDAFKAEKKAADDEGRVFDGEPLETRTLPQDITITIEDHGDGMSREDLRDRFLVAGRRRRADDQSPRTAKGRLIMGRKGLGKLAGFGVARKVMVVSRKKGESHATKITLAYEELRRMDRVEEVVIPDERLDDGGGFASSGTRIELSELLYDPTKSQKETISHELAEHFEMISAEEFAITLNGTPVEPLVREYGFVWPEPQRAVKDLIEESYNNEAGKQLFFSYRMRFTKDEQALPAHRRGVRVYARRRLASAPSLLDADTNMHGFRMTDYLDGSVEADFIDSFAADFIATDRQALRWESPMLVPLRHRLSELIREACKEYQKVRDGAAPGIVRKDNFTLKAIEEAKLDGRDRTLAVRIGTALAKACKRGVKDPVYKKKFPEILRGIGHGNLLSAIANLADEEQPEFHRVAAKVIELTHEEIDSFANLARARIDAITALRKIIEAQDFKEKKKENEVQKLLEEAPWMIDPLYAPILSANESLTTLYRNLAKELAIGEYASEPEEGDDDRPDLVFLLGNEAGGRLVIVELKAPNVPLDNDHLVQLRSYMKRAREWLKANAAGLEFTVWGELIGSMNLNSNAKRQIALRDSIEEAGPEAKWRVRTFSQVLQQTQQAHAEIIAAHKRARAGRKEVDDAPEDASDDEYDDE